MTRFVATLARGLTRGLFLGLILALPVRAEVAIQEVTTPGGITAWLVEEHSIPFTALELRFRGGTSLDQPGKRGATNLMTGLLEEGAGDLGARDFTRAVENLAASFHYDVYDDTLAVSAKFLSENRDAAIELLRQSLVAPRFDPEAIERVRAQVVSGIKSDLTDPDEIASSAFAARIYQDHPYATPGQGDLDSVAGLTRDDLVTAWKNALVRDRLFVGVVGDITAEELSTLLDSLLADLPQSGPALPGEAALHFDGGTHVVEFDTPQSVVRFGQPGMSQDDPDFFAAYLLNTIIGGGGFESVLMQEVREKRGLTYGVYAYLLDKDEAKVWVGSVSSANDRVAETIAVIRAEWARIAANGVSAERLEAAKKYMTGAYPLRFDGNGPIANIIASMQLSGMPIDYAATRNDRVNAVTLEQVNRVAASLMDPEALTFVVTGKPEGLPATAD
ncbi:pitrilysin family protein [Pseudooceanicola sp.]|uniref:M16 family metallopeptidase n=1 Tax=Pseudooceanicola sp. TaxID=1914328 RepID=UPI00260BEF1B|nr:pitrilysin family protein [Pseudooceanicola sp.]MDF1856673.1 pitrilysin family protein [Pseudooceanicola sp.]